jgi:hypothetical protein
VLLLTMPFFRMTEPAHASGSRSADIPFVLHDSVPQMLTCRQLIIVTTKSGMTQTPPFNYWRSFRSQVFTAA